MFTVLAEKSVGICHGGALLCGSRVGLLQNTDSSWTLTALDAAFGAIWSREIAPGAGSMLPSDAHDRMLAVTSQSFDRNAPIVCPMRIVEHDYDGSRTCERACPFISFNQVTHLPDGRGYVISGARWILMPHMTSTRCAAILRVGSSEVRLMPGSAAASLPCGILAWSSDHIVTVGSCEADSIGVIRSFQTPGGDAFRWLFEIDGCVWGVTESAAVCLGRIDADGPSVHRSHSWPEGGVERCVCSPPYIVAAASVSGPPFVMNVRSGELQILSLKSEPHPKELFSIDALSEGGRAKILTLHRTAESAQGIVRLWGDG